MEEIPKVVRYGFLISLISHIVYGAWFFLAPELWNSLTGWPSELAAGRTAGAAILAIGIATIFAFRAKTWKEVEIFVLFMIFWCLLGPIAAIWAFFTMTLPVVVWINIVILLLLLVMFGYGYMLSRK
ncbi:MAG: hypothetical protein ACFFED_16360 [Candidatus Thorarchaeota archaeon]